MWFFFLALGFLILIILLYINLPVFGSRPSGVRLARMQKSPHYKDGKFHNLMPTPALKEGYSYSKVFYDFLFKKSEQVKPSQLVPSIKTDIKQLSRQEDVFIWFGHSSYFLQVNGLRFLIDPVFSGNASPIPNTTRAFKGSDIYSAEDLPAIDFLLITHDHYDHLDYKTIKQLQPKIKNVITGLGVGAHLERWNYKKHQIHELDWWDNLTISENVQLTATPSRHFSGRKFSRNTTLWLSFVLKTPTKTIFLGGDSGYGPHFKEIGNQFAPFDIAILENGQYNEAWHYIHMLPNEIPLAVRDLQATVLIPVHSGKFSLAPHAWNEPLQLLSENAEKENLTIITPIIGEKANLDQPLPVFKKWWL